MQLEPMRFASVTLVDRSRAFRTQKPVEIAHRMGLKFERRYQEVMAKTAPSVRMDWYPSLWLEAQVVGELGFRYFQLDGMLINEHSAIVVEMKRYPHLEGWYRLWHIYRPLIKTLHPRRTVSILALVANPDDVLVKSELPLWNLSRFDPDELNVGSINQLVVPDISQ